MSGMHDLDRQYDGFKSAQRMPQPAMRGHIREGAATKDDFVTVILEGEFDETLSFGPCRWMPHGTLFPEEGDPCIIIFDGQMIPWVVSWWTERDQDQYLTQAAADLLYSVLGHLHDDRYFTESEVTAGFLGISAKAADSNLLDGIDSAAFQLRSEEDAASGYAGLDANKIIAGADAIRTTGAQQSRIGANGHLFKSLKIVDVTFNPPSLAAHSGNVSTLTAASGSWLAGDPVSLWGYPDPGNRGIRFASEPYAPADNQVILHYFNADTITLDLASGTYTFMALSDA